MSMPIIVASGSDRCQAITDMIESVALEQAALAHILNAEGEKLQRAVKASKTTEELLDFNQSVRDMVNSIESLEMILGAKLGLFEDCICENSCPTVTTTCPPIALTLTTTAGSVAEMSPNVYSAAIAPSAVITIATNPSVPIAAASLAAGFTLVGNQLIAPPTMIPFQQYANVITINSGSNCEFAITVNAIYVNA